MREIKLTQGKVALVDDEDYERIMQWHWCTDQRENTYYAKRQFRMDGKQNTIKMHREILQLLPNDPDVDHRNGYGFDNRKENLRLASPLLNGVNCRMRKNNTSGAKGVYWHNKAKKWAVQISINYRKIHIGLYLKIEDAIIAHDNAILHYWGPSAIQHIEGGYGQNALL